MNRLFPWPWLVLRSLLWVVLDPSWIAAHAGEILAEPLPFPKAAPTGFTQLAPADTGITFSNVLSELASASNRVLNNGSGVAAGDVDADGQADLFFANLEGQSRLYKNLGNWKFLDVTTSALPNLPPTPHRGGALVDVTGDGWLDLLITTVSNGILCLANDGAGRFSDMTQKSGLGSRQSPSTLAFADVDGNGTVDVYSCNFRANDHRDLTRIPIMSVNGKPGVTPAFRDRLFFSEGQLLEMGEPDTLFLNDGSGKFTSVSWTGGSFLNEDGVPVAGSPRDWGLTASFRDFNGDGQPDLYVCNDYWTPDRIWLNTGRGIFRLAPRHAFRKTSASSMGVDFADINRDGHMDLFVVDMLARSPSTRRRQHLSQPNRLAQIGVNSSRPQVARNTLFLNRGDGTFSEIGQLAGLHATDWSWSPVFLDVDLDGFEDVIITTGHFRDIQDLDATARVQAAQDSWRKGVDSTQLDRAFVEAKRKHLGWYPRLDTRIAAFRNRGDLRFEDMSDRWGLGGPAVQHGIAFADLDNDGDLDLVCNRLGPAGVFRNNSSAPRVAVRVVGTRPNSQAIGARIELLGGAIAQQRSEVFAGGSYLSGSAPLRVFATGSATNGMTLRVSWRSGATTTVSNVHPNHRYVIPESPEFSSQPSSSVSSSNALPTLFTNVSSFLQHRHHEDDNNEFATRPLLPTRIGTRGPGVAWWDLNRDGWEDLIISSGRGSPMSVFLNQNGQAFSRTQSNPFAFPAEMDQSAVLGFYVAGHGTTILAGTSDPGPNNALPSAHAWNWDKANLDSPVPGFGSATGALALTDMDGDGRLDLFVGGAFRAGQYPVIGDSRLFRWISGKWEYDVDSGELLRNAGLVRGAVWTDLNSDGFPELVLACEWGPVRVFLNDGGRLVRDATSDFGLEGVTGLWSGIASADLNGDGRMDLIVGNSGWNTGVIPGERNPMTLFHGAWVDSSREDIIEAEYDEMLRGPTPRTRPELLTSALPFLGRHFTNHHDFSQKTVLELLGPQFSATGRKSINSLSSTLFLNRGGRFESIPLPTEAQFAPANGISSGDMDGDGDMDVFLSQNQFGFRYEESRLDSGIGLLLRNNGHAVFTPVPTMESGIRIHGDQRGSAMADFDRDRRLDLVVAQNSEDTILYRNQSGKPGIRIILEGPPGNPNGLGAVVRIYHGDRAGPALEVHAGSGYMSQDSCQIIIGINGAPTLAHVTWPGGKKSVIPVPPGATELRLNH